MIRILINLFDAQESRQHRNLENYDSRILQLVPNQLSEVDVPGTYRKRLVDTMH